MRNTPAKILFSWRLRLLLVIVVGALLAFKLLRSIVAIPRYDLLFSIDYNDLPYASSDSPGIVIRVENQKAKAIFMGKWQAGSGPDKPHLYICEVAMGTVREIPVSFELPLNAWRPRTVNRHPVKTLINVPELDSLTIDDSSTAPNSYVLRGWHGNSLTGLKFDEAYAYINLVNEWPIPNAVQLKEDIYEMCLKQVGNDSVGLTVHFIGWVIPAHYQGTAPRHLFRRFGG